jgi:DNA topoisomerase-1
MMVAQKLYEAGYITYMRTDSTRVSDDAIKMAKAYICKNFGENYYLNRNFKTKEGAQDAHEAIRPTKLLDLEKTVASMDKDEAKLYTLIFNRFVASKMEACIYDSTRILIDVENYVFTVTGSVIKFDGFMRLYTEGKDEVNVKDKDEAEEIKELPKLNVGDVLKQLELNSNQKFTEPPSRYTEASLVKVMEEKGIGRPSTYAPTISTLLDRLYIELEAKHLIPTELGEIVNKVMSNNFKDIVDIEFTANMEKQLDNIAEGKQDYIKMLHDFYNPFIKNLDTVSDTMESVKIPDKVSDEVCELCGRQMVIKQSRFGEFLACPGYPECKNTKAIVKTIKEVCPKCGGKVLVRKTKTRKNFYVCENNTNNENSKCDYISWNKPGQEKSSTKKARKTVKTKTTKKTASKTTKKK